MGTKLAEQDVSLWCFKRLLPLLAGLSDSGTQRDRAGNRRLFFDDYVKLMLLYLMNPMIDSLRTLQQASMLNTVAKKLGIARFSLGSFSEASAVFEPELLKSVIQELGAAAVKLPVNPELKQLKHLLTIVDGTLLATLPKLATTWCYSRKDGRPHHAWRLHMHLPLGDLVPELIIRASGSNRKECAERAKLKENLAAGRCYVLDRGFHEAVLFNAIHRADSSYVCRLRNNVNPDVIEELPVTDSAAAAGVVSDRIVKLSTYEKCVAPSDHPVRLITIYTQPHSKRSSDEPQIITLATNLLDVPAELIGTIYQYRWTIELFFRLIKQLLGCRHLLSHRGAGVDIQIYCAMIACLLIYLQTGKRPNKYMLFMTGMYLNGTASLEEMIAFVNRADNTGIKQRAKDELWKKLGVN
jgi:hypothetical protein